MSTVPTLNGQVIGHAHYATRALLERAVAPLGVEFNQVLALNVLANGPVDRADLTHRVTSTLKVDEQEVQRVLATLVDAHLAQVDDEADTARLRLTDAGHAVQARIADAVAGISARLYADIPSDEASAAARALTLVTRRANAELAATPT
ncbi:MarR family winged helix-turn-helix transcriptional regulator [Micromonospora chokoriensis]|uniref:MarR family winged helix-turn-helix transcriptional regulator n=1 Tax=Micromonospora chokoriensis TaxID=356851 RepID=UPI0004C41F4B|nr:MarR family winged helix-turn-helix transcriptional regulator [Micromonospora chokoriensis]